MMKSDLKGHCKVKSCEMICIYGSHISDDDRGRGSIASYHSTERFALEAGKGKGFYGADGTAKLLDALEVVYINEDGDTMRHVYLLAKKDPIDLDFADAKARAEVKKNALAKLSPIEREILGLPNQP